MRPYNYLILILVWAMPVIILQWLIGLDVFIKRWKVWIPCILIPTIYLTVADSLPLASKTWTIAPDQSTGILLPIINVPIEEGIFFLITNTLVVQGLLLFMYLQFMIRRWRIIMSNAIGLFQRDVEGVKRTIDARKTKNTP